MANMADLKAAYRLFAGDGVTFEAIAGSHRELTRQRAGHVSSVG